MTDIDPGAHAKRLAEMAQGKAGVFGENLTGTGGTTAPGTPEGNEILAWLAGNRLRIRDSKDDMRPRPRGATDKAGSLLPEERPENPIDAANTRASVLADLRRDAPEDPRTVSVFEADPIVAEDPSTATVVTSRMLRARGDVFDAVLKLVGRPALTRSARSWMAVHLSNAFTVLSEAAQKEWALSEMRMEETRAFLDRRPQTELDILAEQIGAIIEKRDIWDAARAFSIAAHIGIGDSTKSARLADLLELRDLGDD